MKKRLFCLFLCFSILCSVSGCSTKKNTYEKTLKIKLETANRYSFIDKYGIMINNTYFNYKDILGGMWYDGFSLGEDKVYFSGHDSRVLNYGEPIKAAIWSIDYRTGKASLVREIDTVSMPYGNGTVECFLKDRVALRYNGMFEIFDMKNNRTLYKEATNVGYYTDNGYKLESHYGIKTPNNIFEFYENHGDYYQLHTFVVDKLWDMRHVYLINDSICFYGFDGEQQFAGVNYKTGEYISAKEVEDMISPFTSNDGITITFFANGESFKYYETKNENDKIAPLGITIERKSDGIKRVIGCEYLYNKSPAYKKITDLWKKHNTRASNYSFQPCKVFVADEKIIISCEARDVNNGFLTGFKPPLYFIEYNFNTETVLYAGVGGQNNLISNVVQII